MNSLVMSCWNNSLINYELLGLLNIIFKYQIKII